jgi:hypothetical protein
MLAYSYSRVNPPVASDPPTMIGPVKLTHAKRA